MAGISSKAAGGMENKYKYNGIEFTEDIDLDMYDAFYRNLDPQTGRWWQIDPKVDAGYESISPYASMYDDSARYSDPLGDEADEDDGGPGGPPGMVGSPMIFGPSFIKEAEKLNGILVEGTRRVLITAGGVLNGIINTLSFGTYDTNPAEAITGSNTMTTADQERYNTSVSLGEAAGMITPLGEAGLGAELAPVNGPKVSLPRGPILPGGILKAVKKSLKDLVEDAKAAQQKEAAAAQRAASREAATREGKIKVGRSNQGTRGSHNSGGSNPGKHDKAEARRAREQKAADAAKKIEN